MTTTAKLEIPLIDGAKPLLTRQFNEALQAVDKNALAKAHEKSPAHWGVWQKTTTYKKQDVFRTEGLPSWAFWEVTKAGTSGATAPKGWGEGDKAQDGTAELVLRRLGAEPKKEDPPAPPVVPIEPSKAQEWQTGKAYKANQLVTHNASLFLCLADHTSGVFADDKAAKRWKQIDSDQTVIGSASGYVQITKRGITEHTVVNIPVHASAAICLPPAEVLRFFKGASNVTQTICDFDANEEDDFKHDGTAEFTGTLHVRERFTVPMSKLEEIGTNAFYSESETIDCSRYKSISSVFAG